ncbi:MAG: glycosyltransferase [Saprospiraceae bacterium]
MLSILIPLYRYDLRPLIDVLSKEISGLGQTVEILVFDDGSGKEWDESNAEIKQNPLIRWIDSPTNIGRAAARNALAAEAKMDWLLFMDCDGMPEDPHFIKMHISSIIMTEAEVIVGGRSYAPQIPADPFILHWKYGSSREVIPAKKRAEHPFRSFMTNNFVIRKSRFEEILFDPTIRLYGHEDTLFGLELKNRQIHTLHIENPMRHIGLDEKTAFLHKSELALHNLIDLHKKGYELDVKILKYALLFRKFGLHLLLRPFAKLKLRILKWNLLSRRPSLFLFDCYRLVYLLTVKSREFRV